MDINIIGLHFDFFVFSEKLMHDVSDVPSPTMDSVQERTLTPTGYYYNLTHFQRTSDLGTLLQRLYMIAELKTPLQFAKAVIACRLQYPPLLPSSVVTLRLRAFLPTNICFESKRASTLGGLEFLTKTRNICWR